MFCFHDIFLSPICFQYVGLVASLLQHFFSDGSQDFLRGTKTELETNKEVVDRLNITRAPGGLKYLILTKPGEGPETLGEDQSLLDKNGMPKIAK